MSDKPTEDARRAVKYALTLAKLLDASITLRDVHKKGATMRDHYDELPTDFQGVCQSAIHEFYEAVDAAEAARETRRG